MKRIALVYYGAGILWFLFAYGLIIRIPKLDAELNSADDDWSGIILALLIAMPALVLFGTVGWKIAGLEKPDEAWGHRLLMAFTSIIAFFLLCGMSFAFISLLWDTFRPEPIRDINNK